MVFVSIKFHIAPHCVPYKIAQSTETLFQFRYREQQPEPVKPEHDLQAGRECIMNTEMKALLGKCPLFTGFHEGQLESLYDRAEVLDFDRDQTIFEEEAPGNSVFVLIDGSVDVEKKTPDGDQMILTTLSIQGDIFGEMSIIDARRRSATVRARGNTTLLSVTKEALFDLYDEYPELMLLVPSNIAIVLAERLQAVDEIMSVLSG